MKSLRKMVKANKLLYKILLPAVQKWRDFIAGPVSTTAFYIGHVLRKAGILKCDPVLKRVENRYKNKHKRIFIIATGPSLKMSDLEWLEKNNEMTMSVNGIFKIFDKVTWRPDFYVMDDRWVYRRYKEAGIQLKFEENCKKLVFLSNEMKKELEYVWDKKKTAFISMCYWDHWYNTDSKHYKYSRDIKYGHYDMYTVTSLAINLADYMGFEKIYLLGADCDYRNSVMHIGEDSSENRSDHNALIKIEDAQRKGYRLLSKELKNRVFNATRGGALEEFERVDMDAVIRGEV